MTPWRTALCSILAVVGFAIAVPAEAGWQSAFQATCFRKGCFSCFGGDSPAVAAYTPAPACSSCFTPSCSSCCTPAPCATCQPCQTCETRYVARSFYQPVTSYQCRSYYEPVTSYRTSYYYEPQTTCRYTCTFDPCTCSYRMVATPVTSYSLKAQTCPVQSFVQRTMMVPVTSYRIATYYEPQTCCTPTAAPAVVAAAAPASGCCGSTPAAAAPAVTENPSQPAVQEQRQPAPSGGSSPLYDQKNSSPLPNPSGNQTGFRPAAPARSAPPAAARQPIVAPRLDKIAMAEDGPRARLARRITIVDDE